MYLSFISCTYFGSDAANIEGEMITGQINLTNNRYIMKNFPLLFDAITFQLITYFRPTYPDPLARCTYLTSV